ncbi:Exocyst complex component 5 [Balamuthia mandrillaris]
MSMAPGDVRRFKREDFEVRDYVDTITKRLVYDMTVKDEEEKNSKHNKNKEQVVLFNIKPFLTLFEGTLEELNKLQKQIEKKALAQEQDCKAEEEAYKSKVTVQSRSFEKTFAGFKELDQRIYKVGDTAVQIGDRLEALEKQRSKAVEIADLIQHFIKLNQGTAEREKNGVEEDGLTSKQASSLKKLNSFTQELERVEEEVKLTRKEREDLDYIQTAGSSGGVVGSSTNNGLGATSTAPSSQFRHLAWSLSQDPVAERLRLNEHLLDRTKEGKEAVEKESNKLENKLLQEFDEASQRNDYAKMKEVASILNEFNGCGSCIRHYIMKLNMFFDTESINMDSALAEAGEHRISTNELEDTKEDARIHAFFYDITHACKHEYEVISKVFPNPAVVMRELAQRIFEQRIGMFLEKMLNIRDSSPESLLFYLRILKSAHAETCQFVKVLQEYNIGQFDFSSMVQSLFYKYMSSYISNETKYLRLFYENHLAQLQQEAEKNRASRSWPGAPTNSKTPKLATVTALTSLEPIFAFLHCSEGAVERCLELSSKEDISQNLYQIFEMLLEYLGYRYLSPALEHALLQLKKRKSSTSPTTFFQITQQVNQSTEVRQQISSCLAWPTPMWDTTGSRCKWSAQHPSSEPRCVALPDGADGSGVGDGRALV